LKKVSKKTAKSIAGLKKMRTFASQTTKTGAEK